jgi:hypothetical protein
MPGTLIRVTWTLVLLLSLLLAACQRGPGRSAVPEEGTGGKAVSSAPSGYPGEAVDVDPQHVAPGPGNVRLNLAFPPGYKLNGRAPLIVEGPAEGLVTLDGGTRQELEAPAFPLDLPATFEAGEGRAQFDLTLYYCEEVQADLCLVKRLRFRVPLTVGAGGVSHLVLHHTLAEADL